MADNTIKVDKLTEKQSLELADLIAVSDSNGVLYRKNLDKLQTFLNSIGVSAYKGMVTPNVGGIPQKNGSDITENGFYIVSENGDYGTFTNLNISDTLIVLGVENISTTPVYSKTEIPISITVDATPTEGSANAVQSGGVASELKKVDLKFDSNLIPTDSRFDSETTISGNDIGVFTKSTGTATLSNYENGIKINSTVASNCIIQNTTILNDNEGDTIYYDFWAKRVSGTSRLYLVAGNTVLTANSVSIDLTDEWVNYTGSLVVGSANEDRLAFITASSIIEYGVRDFKVFLNVNDKGVIPRIEELETVAPQITTNKNEIDKINSEVASNNILAVDSRFDENSVIDGTSLGNWFKQAGDFNLSKNTDGSFKVELTSTSTMRFVNLDAISTFADNDEFEILLEIKRINPSGNLFFDFTTSATGQLIPKIDNEWQSLNFTATKTNQYLNRIGFIMTTPAVDEEFDIRLLVIAKDEIQFSKFYNVDKRIDDISNLSYQGKNISIIADSIGTLSGNNATEIEIFQEDIDNNRELTAYVSHWDVWTDSAGTTPTNKEIGNYTLQASDIGTQVSLTPVSGDVGKTIGEPLNYNSSTIQTWGKLLADKLGMNLLQNVGWSGSKITSKNESSSVYKTSHAWHPATINKCRKRNTDNSFTNPDVILITRVTNDFSHTPYTLIGDIDLTSTTVPSDDVITGGFGYKEGLALTIKNLRNSYPNAEIWIATGTDVERINFSGDIVHNGTHTLAEYNEAVREIGKLFSCKVLELDKCGIHLKNIKPTYANDGTHLNSFGHSFVSDKIYKNHF